MKKRLFILLFPLILFADFHASVKRIDGSIRKRMLSGDSYRKGCPVALEDLRYLNMSYIGFDAQTHRGEMVVHKEVADEVTEIFALLYRSGYPIRQMRLVSDFGGSDWKSIEADNTSAFNCRKATGSQKWSKHSYGKAIDLNPIENPYIARNGHIAHNASLVYRKRVHKNHKVADEAVLLKTDKVVHIFKKCGWKWGGDWHGVKDYQHFSK